MRLLFLEKLARFHDLQGARLRIPTLEGRRLDLHKLHTIVQREGGFEKVSVFFFLFLNAPFQNAFVSPFWSSGICCLVLNTTFLLEQLTILIRLDQVSREGRWYRIQEKMGYKPSKPNASTLKSHYEKILFPYDVFLSGVLTGDESVCRTGSNLYTFLYIILYFLQTYRI